MKKYIVLVCLAFACSSLFLSAPLFAAEKEDEEKTTNTSVPDLLGDDDGWDGTSAAQNNEKVADISSDKTISDPLEPMNRVFFSFNNHLYDWVLKPVSDGYSWAVPYELRDSFDNVFNNISAPVRLVNSLLQGDLEKSWVIVERFVINSTLGVLGMTDVADYFGMKPQKADFGQTLGMWGVGFGPYICWPFLGPSSLRDSVGFGVDSYLHPVQYLVDEWSVDIGYYSADDINYLSLHPGLIEDLRRISLDPYVAARQAYYDYRVNVINGGSEQMVPERAIPQD